jgi:NADPH2:quinone reductase
MMVNRRFRLRRRPAGQVTEDDLELVEEPVPRIGHDQALVRTLWLSLDPSNRISMSSRHYKLPPVAIDSVMRGIGIGQVVESERDDMRPGDLVSGLTGWQDYAVADDEADELPFGPLPSPLPGPLTAFLGPLGHTGVTAYLGIEDIGRPRPGETMVVSAAAGAVGSIAGQLGKARGARVVGIAGSESKRRHVIEDLHMDACINRRDHDWRDQLDAATPDGIDVDFENAGGPVMAHVLERLNVGGRVVLCGLIADYDSYDTPTGRTGQVDIALALMLRRARMQSFLVLDHADRFPEAIGHLGRLIDQGTLAYHETIVEGLERAPHALKQLFDGTTTGKLLVKVADHDET